MIKLGIRLKIKMLVKIFVQILKALWCDMRNFPVAFLVGKATRFKTQINLGLNPLTAISELCDLSVSILTCKMKIFTPRDGWED